MDILKFIKSSILLYFWKEDNKNYNYIKSSNAVLPICIITALSLIGLLISFFSTYFLYDFGEYEVFGFIIAFFGILLLTPLFIFIFFGITHLFLKLFGGSASFEETVKFGASITILQSLFALIYNFVPNEIYANLNLENLEIVLVLFLFILLLISFTLFIWGFIISILTYAKLHKISTLKCFFAILCSIIIPSIILILVIAILIISFSQI